MSEFGQNQPPTPVEYQRAFDLYVARVSAIGGSVFRVEQSENGLLTWAVKLPGVPQDVALQRLQRCHADTFRDVELAYVRSVLGSSSEMSDER